MAAFLVDFDDGISDERGELRKQRPGSH